MALPSPYEHVDDRGLVEACSRSDEDGLRVLEVRYGRIVRAISHRVAEDRGTLAAAGLVSDGTHTYLKRNQFGPLRTWTGSRLSVFLAVAVREVGGALLSQDPNATLSGSTNLPTTLVEDLLGRGNEYDDEEPTSIDRLSPYVSVMLRLRLHGLGATGIALALGTTRPAVLHQLGLIAQHLGHGDESTTEAFRLVLGHASHSERVLLALRTERDLDFRGKRRAALTRWEEFRTRAAARRPSPSPSCLTMDSLAGLVDGSLRGPSRTLAEGHVGGCAHCADRLAFLVTDQSVITPLRESARLTEHIAQLAAAVSTLRPELAFALAPRAQSEDARRVRWLVRIAKALQAAGSLGRLGSLHPPSLTTEENAIPTDDEAPIVALESLVACAPATALRAIDEHLARRTVGRRLRLLAMAAIGDREGVHALADDVMERSSPDPELVRDIDAVVAVPEGFALPNEVLAERIRTLVPDVVRYVVDLGR